MFDDMHEDIIDAHICVGVFHSVAIFFNEAIVSFNGGSKRFKFLIQDRTWDNRSVFSVTIGEPGISYLPFERCVFLICAVEWQLC